MNRLELLGWVGKDGVLKTTAEGTAILELDVADVKRKGETNVTDWFRVVLYGPKAKDFAPLCKEGVEVLAIGEYQRRESRGKTYEQLNADVFRVCTPRPKA